MQVRYHELHALRKTVWALAALFAAGQLFVGLNNDNLTLLYYSIQMITDGGLYERWIEINPPLIMLIYSVPAAAIVWLKLPPVIAFQGFAVLLCAASTALIQRTLARAAFDKEWRARLMDISLLILFVLPGVAHAFGDREHLFIVFALPWIIEMLWGNEPGWRTSLPAAIGFCIKPYNLVVAAALIVFAGPAGRTLTAKLRTPSTCIIVAVGAVYIAVVLLFFPGYFTRVLPLLFTTYSTVNYPWQLRARYMITYPIPALLLVVLTGFPRRLPWYGLIASLAVCYALNAGWAYTFYLFLPPLALVCMSIVPAEGALTPHRSPREARLLVIVPLLIMSVLCYFSLRNTAEDIVCTYRTGYPVSYHHRPLAMMAELKKEADGEYVLLSYALWGINISGLGAPPQDVYAFNALWPLPWLAANPDDARAPFVREMITAPLVAALSREVPPVLIVDRSRYIRMVPENFDLLAFLRKDTTFKTVLGSYRQVRTIDYCGRPPENQYNLMNPDEACRFTVWKRK